METKKLIRRAVMTVPLLALAACGQSSSQTRSDDPAGMITMAAATSDSPEASRLAPDMKRPVARFPEDMLRDPAERFALIERLRMQIVSRTHRVPEPRWRAEVRPALHRQLETAGLSRGDVEFLLWEVDMAKPLPAETITASTR
jgi:hypothetical protein